MHPTAIPIIETASPFLTPKQLAARWQCSTEKIKRMRRAGNLRVHYIGRAARFKIEDVLAIETAAAA